MFDELNAAIDSYQTKWQALCAGRKDAAFFDAMKPTAVGWKVAGLDDYKKLLNLWHDTCDSIVEIWMNDRYIAKMHVREELHWGIEIIKLMQRWPASNDAVGLDHLDFYTRAPLTFAALQTQEPDLKFTEEENGFCSWVSLWFDGTEAKLRNDTIFTTVQVELDDLEKRILKQR